jgi:hypothetical protein
MRVCRAWKLAAMEPAAWIESKWTITLGESLPAPSASDLALASRSLIRRLVIYTALRRAREDEIRRLFAGYSGVERFNCGSAWQLRYFVEMNSHDPNGRQMKALSIGVGADRNESAAVELEQLLHDKKLSSRPILRNKIFSRRWRRFRR